MRTLSITALARNFILKISRIFRYFTHRLDKKNLVPFLLIPISALAADPPVPYSKSYMRHAGIQEAPCSRSTDPATIVQERDFILKTLRKSIISCMHDNRVLEICLDCNILNNPCQDAGPNPPPATKRHKEEIWNICSEKRNQILQEEGLISKKTGKWNLRFIKKYASELRRYFLGEGLHPLEVISPAKKKVTPNSEPVISSQIAR